MKIFPALGLIALFSATTVHASDNEPFTVGAVASFGSSDYATDDKVTFVPLFLYDNDVVYLEGSEAGVYALKNDKHWARLGVSHEGRHFEPSDAKQNALRGLDERKSSVNAQASYMYITPVGGFEAKITSDVLGKSDAQTLSLTHRSRFKFADDRLTIYPRIGVTWYSDDYNEYYYGVSAQESARTGVSEYRSKSGLSPFVAVSARYRLFDKVGLFAHHRTEWLSSDQKNSPLTDDSTKTVVGAGITYDF